MRDLEGKISIGGVPIPTPNRPTIEGFGIVIANIGDVINAGGNYIAACGVDHRSLEASEMRMELRATARAAANEVLYTIFSRDYNREDN